MRSYEYVNAPENTAAAAEFIAAACAKYGADRHKIANRMMYITKLLQYIAQVYPQGQSVTAEVTSFLGDIKVRLYYRGRAMDEDALMHYTMDHAAGRGGVETVKQRRVLKNCFSASSASHKHTDEDMNITAVTIKKSSYKRLVILLAALAAGVGVGLLIRAVFPDAAGAFLAENIFDAVSDVFVNCVKMLIAPLMFFTISSSISAYTDLSSLGRMGAKLVVRYLANAIIAMAVAAAVLYLIRPGVDDKVPALQSILAGSSSVEQTVENLDVSVRDTLVDFFPSNFFGAFVDSSMMQIIFISMLLGIAAGMLDVSSREGIHRFLQAGNRLFCKMTDIVMLVLPVSVFCSMANTVILMGAETLLLLIRWGIALLAGFAAMAVVFILLTALFARVGPRRFLKSYSEAILSTFAMGSCSASLPVCMSTMEKRVGVQNKTTALTMPIGVSIHSASNCVFYLISAFFLANLYHGAAIAPLAYPMIFFTVFVLGIGAPSISGAGPICVAMLLPQLGVPMGMITLIIGLDPLVSMFKSACSCLEDASVTLAIAKSENTLDG